MAIFGRKDKDSEAPYPVFQPERRDDARPEAAPGRREAAAVTTIGPTLRVKGEILGDEDMTIDGRVEGIIQLSRSLTVGKSGVVEADVRAAAVVVFGRLLGNVVADQRVEIQPSGRLEGNIKCPKITILEGAHFRGNVDMSAVSPGPGQTVEEPRRPSAAERR